MRLILPQVRQLFVAIVMLVFLRLPTHAQQVQFTHIDAQTGGTFADITPREATRIERFLSHVFPTRNMKRFARTADRPYVRRVTYSVVSQQGKRFIVAGFTGMWHQAVDVFGVYRLEKEGPNQVWRSGPWHSDYYGWRFTGVDLGSKSLLLFQEGADENNFGLASVISFQDQPKGLIIHDLTPTLPRLRAYTNFPFRPLYGQNIRLQMREDAKPSIVLSASDEQFQLSSTYGVRPMTEWRFNKVRSRFERIGSGSVKGAMTHINKE